LHDIIKGRIDGKAVRGWKRMQLMSYLMKNRSYTEVKLECGPVPNVMATLLNIGGALCLTPQSLADTHYYSAVH